MKLNVWTWYKVSQVGKRHEQGPRGWLLGAWTGNSKTQGSDGEALAKGSEEKAPDVFPTLTLTFEREIGSLAILRSSCGDI